MNRNIIVDLNHIFRSCVSSVLPENLIRKSLNFNSSTKQLKISDKLYELKDKNVYVVGTGKAVQRMANELERILSGNIKKGIISIPKGSSNIVSQNSTLKYYEGAENNLPDAAALDTACKIKQLVSELRGNDILFVLISGGGSSLLPLPQGLITLQEKCILIKKLANSGADITELNTVRKRISDIKGGKLALHAYPAQVVSLILSDIVGDPIDLIASGPTCKNTDKDSAALDVIDKYNLYSELPQSIIHVLGSPSFNEFKDNADNIIVGSNKISTEAGMIEAKNRSYTPINLSNSVVGNVRDIASKYAKLVKIVVDIKHGVSDIDFTDSVIDLNIPGMQSLNVNTDIVRNENVCFILGGEITVEVRGDGKGGRNQQLALEFSKATTGFKTNYDIYMLSAGTDGVDGPTDAAGAIGYHNLIQHAEAAGMDPDVYLENNDSYSFYKNFANGDLHIITGHTNTNVMDIHLIIIKKQDVMIL